MDEWQGGLRRLMEEVTGGVFAVALGVWVLLLFVTALAWDPLDRRLGLHTRRRDLRRATRLDMPVQLTREIYGAQVSEPVRPQDRLTPVASAY